MAKTATKPEEDEQAQPTAEQMCVILQQQLDDAHLVIGQKEMQIQRQMLLIHELQREAGK